MKRFFKLVIYLISGVFLLLLVLLASIYVFIDPNDYRPQIATWVEKSTGRPLVIEEGIAFAFFPYLGFDLGHVRLGNAPGFQDTPFAQADTAHLRIKLIPLLIDKRLEVGALHLTGLTLTLTRKADGTTNWADWGQTDKATDSTPLWQDLAIQDLNIQAATVIWDDQQAAQRIVFAHSSLTARHFAFETPTPVILKTSITSEGLALPQGELTLETEVTADWVQQRYQLNPLQIVATGHTQSGDQQAITVNTQVDLDLSKNRLTLTDLNSQALGATLTGSLQVSPLLLAPALSGQIQVATTELSTRLQSLQLPALPLKTAQLSTTFQASLVEGIRLADVRLQSDDNYLQLPELKFDFLKDRLDIPTLTAHVLGIDVQGQLQVAALTKQPQVQGRVQVSPFDPQIVWSQLTPFYPTITPLPDLSAYALLKEIALKSQFTADHAAIKLKNLHVQLDDSQVETPLLTVDLAQQKINSEALHLQAFQVAALHSQLTIEQIFTQPTIQAVLTLDPFNPQLLLKRLGQSLPALTPLLPLTGAALKTQVTVTPNDITAQHFQLHVDGHTLKSPQVHFQRDQQALAIAQWTLDLQETATVHGEQLAIQTAFTQPKGQALIHLTVPELRTLLKQLGYPVPKTTDPSVLAALTLEMQIAGDPSQLALNNINLQLDESRLQGQFRLHDLSKLAATFALQIDQLDLDRYLPPQAQSGGKTTKDKKTTLDLPIAWLKAIQCDGTFKINQLTAAHLKMQDVHMQVSAKEGHIKINPSAQLYQGHSQAHLTLETEKQPPQLTLVGAIKQVQAQPLWADLIGKERFSGVHDLAVDLSAEMPALMDTLTGHLSFKLTEGAIKGLNLGYALRQAKALLEGQSHPPDELLQTDFSSLQGHFTLDKGLLKTQDLILKSPLLRAQGDGQLNINTQDLTFLLKTTLVNTSKGQAGKELDDLKGILMPINIKGNLADTSWQVEVSDIKTVLLENAKAILARKLKKEMLEQSDKKKLLELLKSF